MVLGAPWHRNCKAKDSRSLQAKESANIIAESKLVQNYAINGVFFLVRSVSSAVAENQSFHLIHLCRLQLGVYNYSQAVPTVMNGTQATLQIYPTQFQKELRSIVLGAALGEEAEVRGKVRLTSRQRR